MGLWATWTLCVLTASAMWPCRAEIFTALSQLEKALDVEHDVAHRMRVYIQEERARLEALQSIADEMEEHSTSASGDIEKQLGNPVHAFLVVKRFTSLWNDNTKNNLRSARSQELLEGIESAAAHLPDEQDLRGAAHALLRLQDTYALRASDLALGVIEGVTDSPTMTAGDCFELGKQAYNDGDYYHVLGWLPQALLLLDSEVQPTTDRATVLDYLAFATYKQGNLQHAYNLTQQWLQIEPDHTRALSNLQFYKESIQDEEARLAEDRIARPRPDVIQNPHHRDEYRASKEFAEYESLCRGEDTKVNPDAHKLTCQYKRHHPMFVINPLREETMYLKPFIAIYHGLMTDKEQAKIKELSVPKLHRSGVFTYPGGNSEKVQKYRTSQSAWLSDRDDPLIARLTQRTSALAGLTTDTVEDFQVVNYGIGGHYEPHYDFAREHELGTFEGGVGNRIATVIFYVAAPESGGATVFPDLGVKLWPEKGACALWYNLLKNGNGDFLTKHAGCPTLAGSKWISNKWYHERGQEWARPCSLDPVD